MPRPCKCRHIECSPKAIYFKPRGIPLIDLEEVALTIDEFEAVRLADLEGMYQEEAAQKMSVSRQTFGNIILSAHKKIADFIVNGKAIKIEGGMYIMAETRKFCCNECNHEWEQGYGTGRPAECPQCKAKNIQRRKR